MPIPVPSFGAPAVAVGAWTIAEVCDLEHGGGLAAILFPYALS